MGWEIEGKLSNRQHRSPKFSLEESDVDSG